jgi:NAD(P) transhydrogenase subunit beta
MYFDFIIELTYLISALLFIIGLRRLSSPDTARKGNVLAAWGMGLAIIASLVAPLSVSPNNYLWILPAMVVGGGIGYQMAAKVPLTAMPQLVSIFNGFGGACAVLLGSIELYKLYFQDATVAYGELAIIIFTVLVGSVSFTGSMLAYLKLDGKVDDKKVTLKQHTWVNIFLLAISVALGVWIIAGQQSTGLLIPLLFLVISLVYGFSFVAPIGGADMPVVISLLNSFTGLTAAAAGLIYDNQIMLLGGAFVGAAGTILTILMCEAMNRSLLNVIIGSFGGSAITAEIGGEQRIVKEVTPNDAAILLAYSKSVIFVPGYGLAVAQAQKDVKELDDLLEKNGVNVRYAIHPVAGRMPGHMNVLLAEADVPYPKLLDLEEANPLFPDTDVVVVVGANDVVNPAALDEPGSPIYGMPVLQVWKAKHVIVMKRSMSQGYAGIDNPLFFHERNQMLFGDAKQSMQTLVREVKDL